MRAILTYHSIDDSGSPISVSAATFARHAAFLASGAVRVVPLKAFAHPQTSPGHEVAITFDDGFANFAEAAWPLLRDHELPATLFVVTDRTGSTNAWNGVDEPGIPTLPLMDWDALRRLSDEGLELGSHSRTHPHLDRVDDARLVQEVDGSAEELADRTGALPATFCYPYGDFDERAAGRVADRYDVACTTDLRTVHARDRRELLPRLDAYYYRPAGRLEAFGTTRFRAHLRVRRWARAARRAWTS